MPSPSLLVFALYTSLLMAAGVCHATVQEEKDAPNEGEDPPPRARYLEVPIQGSIGNDVLAAGIREALSWAVARHVAYVVFEIKCGGGNVFETRAIMDIMREFDEKLRYVAVVDSALSAAIAITYGCDEVFVRPDAVIGAAVSYSKDIQTGNVEVDAKFNSAWASEVASVAEAKGYEPILARAMIILEAEVYVVRDIDGNIACLTREPTGDLATRLIVDDTEQTILTLTAKQAVDVGLAAAFDGDISELGKRLGIERWSSAGKNRGRFFLDKARHAKEDDKTRDRSRQHTRESIRRDFPALVDNIVAGRERARSLHPSRFGYSLTRTGAFMGQSRLQWQRNCDVAINEWFIVLQRLRLLVEMEKQANKLGLKSFTYELDVMDVARTAEREIVWLRNNYYISKPPIRRY